MDQDPLPYSEPLLEQKIEECINLYPQDIKDPHSRNHIKACLSNLTVIRRSPEGSTITKEELMKASLAIALHDLGHHDLRLKSSENELTTFISEFLKDTSLSKNDIRDIITAVINHDKPKSRWVDPFRRLSTLVYDADKMDTRKERFFLPTDPSVDKDGVNLIKYYGYVVMVRDSTTYSVARQHLTTQLPIELQVYPNDQSQSAEAVRVYYDRMHQVWEYSTLPAKRIAAKLCLQSTGNANYTGSIQEQLGPRNEEVTDLSDLRRSLIQFTRQREEYTQYVLNHLDELLDIANNGNGSKEKLKQHLTEKLFTYDMFIRAVLAYPRDREDDLKKLYFRNPKLLRKNYDYFVAATVSGREALTANFEDRRKYFQKLAGNRYHRLRHFSKEPDFDALIGGRRLLDKEMKDILIGMEVVSLEQAIDKAIQTRDSAYADKVLRYFRQDALRAVDRVNDVFGTDRFIYFLLEGQIIDTPVGRLPYIYMIDRPNITDHKAKIINYSNPSHPQALHAMKLHSSPYDAPNVLVKTIRMFTQGLFLPEDYEQLVTDIFALTCDPTEIDQRLFDFIFESIIVNEESPIRETSDGRFVADEWLEVNYQIRNNPLWNKASEIVERINKLCAEKGIIPPLRPYVAIAKDINLQAVGAVIIPNPILDMPS